MRSPELISVVIPAHNAAATIDACLSSLRRAAISHRLEVTVVCNGCTDDTARIAREAGWVTHVVETPIASKVAALNAGDALAGHFPRFYVDADVVLSEGSLDVIADALADGRALIAAPAVHHDLTGSSWAVRSHHEIWARLPSVKHDTVGRGVYALSEEARSRFRSFPDILADDHFVRDLVEPERRAVVPAAVSTVGAAATYRQLLRRKVRVYAGNRRLDRSAAGGRQRAKARQREWLQVVRDEPRLVVHLPLYLISATLPRIQALALSAAKRDVRWGT